MNKLTHVIKRNGALVEFKQDRITNAIFRAAVAVGGRDRKTAQNISDQVMAALREGIPAGKIPNVEEIQDMVEKMLIENGHAAVAKAYILYRHERSQKRTGQKALARHSTANVPWKKIWYTLDWAVSHNLHTVDALNSRIENGEFGQIIEEAEAIYHHDVENAIDMIAERRDELRVVIVTGPSSSGKTTTTAKINEKLETMGLRFATLNVDNYFFDLEMHPQDEFGDYDFETPQALDLPLVNQHLNQLLAGEEVMIPYYDFLTSKRSDTYTPMKLEKDEVVLIDSLHGLYPAMTEGIAPEQQFKLYLEPLLQLKTHSGEYVLWTDIRLIRRMLRDSVHRNWPMEHTLTHWHYVRSSEMRNIIPYITTADYIINTGMPYELPIYRPRMLKNFQKWEDKYRHDPLREDAYNRAKRVRELLEQIVGVEDDSPVPPDSVLREFIGGSVYESH